MGLGEIKPLATVLRENEIENWAGGNRIVGHYLVREGKRKWSWGGGNLTRELGDMEEKIN